MDHLSPPVSTRRFLFLLLLISVLGAGLRLYKLADPGVWIDEMYSVRDAIDLDATFFNAPPKVFGYVSTHLGLRLAGADLEHASPDQPYTWQAAGIDHFAIRIGSCLTGILTVPLLGFMSRRFLGDRVALIATLLLAVAPWHIYWSQGGRFYSQQFLFYNMALILYFMATREQKMMKLALAVLLAGLAFFSQLTAAAIAVIWVLDLILDRFNPQPIQISRRGWLWITAIGVLCIAVLIYDIFTRTHEWVESFKGSTAGAPLFILGAVFFVGPSLVTAGVLMSRAQWAVDRRRTVYLLLGGIIPIIVFASLSMRQHAGTRYSFCCLYAWIALGALGLDQLWRMLRPKLGLWAAATPLLVVMAPMSLVLAGYYTQGQAFHPRWQEAFAFVAEHRQPGERVRTSVLEVGQYYMQEDSVGLIPRGPQDMAAVVTEPTWLVSRAALPMTGLTGHWLDGMADLRVYFDVWNVRPLTSIRVYHYAPTGGSPSQTSQPKLPHLHAHPQPHDGDQTHVGVPAPVATQSPATQSPATQPPATEPTPTQPAAEDG